MYFMFVKRKVIFHLSGKYLNASINTFVSNISHNFEPPTRMFSFSNHNDGIFFTVSNHDLTEVCLNSQFFVIFKGKDGESLRFCTRQSWNGYARILDLQWLYFVPESRVSLLFVQQMRSLTLAYTNFFKVFKWFSIISFCHVQAGNWAVCRKSTYLGSASSVSAWNR